MVRSRQVLFMFGLVCLGGYGSAIEFRIPVLKPLRNVISKIKDTTIGIVKGGFHIFGRTIDRVINTFGKVEDRLRELFEELRRQIIHGIPEFSIPILDPLHIEKLEFDMNHNAANIKGMVNDVTIKYISKFKMNGERFSDLGNLRFKLDMNLTFPSLYVTGEYAVDGLLGQMFVVFGNGDFWLKILDLHLSLSTIIKVDYPRLRLIALNVHIQLAGLQNQFSNLMSDEEVGQLFNKAISKIAPEAIDIFWPDVKGPVEDEIVHYINEILENATVASFVRRLFNIK